MAERLELFRRFCREHLRTEAGAPLQLEPIQERELEDYFAGVRELVTIQVKKSGKTTLVAGVALFELVTNPDFRIAIAANSRDQALRTRDQADGFIRRSPWLAERLHVVKREIRSRRAGGRIEILAADADTVDGWIGERAFLDELHRAESLELYGILSAGIGPTGGTIWTFSTAGDDTESPLGKIRQEACKMAGFRKGGPYKHVSAPGFAYHELALDEGDDPTDFALVKRVHPSWVSEDQLRAMHASPGMTDWFWQRFYCGLWVKGEGSAISPSEWADAELAEGIPDGERITLGIDVGLKWDTTAIVPLWEHDDSYRFGTPEILVPPRDGSAMPHGRIVGAIRAFTERFTVERVVIDPEVGGELLGQQIEAELELEVATHPQSTSAMCMAAQRFTTTLGERKLEHPGDPAFTEHVLAAVVKTLPDGRFKFVKDRKPIDALIAATMALSVEIAEPTAAPFVLMADW